MTHLGDRAAALVDGQLSPAEAERAAQHLVGCRDCRDAVERERLTKHRLATLGTLEPAADFVGLLMAMGGPAGPLPPRERRLPVMPPLPTAAAERPTSAADRPAGRATAPARPPGRAPSRAPGRLPDRIADRHPGRVADRHPGRVAVRTPARSPLRARSGPHLAVAAIAAACFVGAGVAVAGAGVAAGSTASPAGGGVRPLVHTAPVGASLVAQRGSSRAELPFTSTSAVWTRVRP